MTSKSSSTTKQSVQIGDIYKIKATEENGITPKDGLDYRYKYFIVMGKAADGSIYGCAAFDSEVNRDYLQPGSEEFYLGVEAGRYPFLKKDSVIDCLKLKPATATKLLLGKFMGQILEEDYNRILALVRMSPRHPFMYLKMLGLN